jgi:hypothetical protein
MIVERRGQHFMADGTPVASMSTAFDIFGSEFPDDAFENVFNQSRQRSS